MMQLQNSKKIAYCGLLTALAMILSYVEALIPIDFGIPGVKLGLANAVSVIAIYFVSPIYVYLIVAARILLSGFLFGNMYSILYSLSGGFISLFFMLLLKRINKFSIMGVSIAGGVFHNLGQLLVAIIVVNQLKLSFYGPVLIISGCFAGTLIGIISIMIKNKLKHMFDSASI